eukprot:gene42359-51736_t
MEEVPRARLSLLKNRVKLRVPVVQLVSEEEKSEEKMSSEPEVSSSSSSSAVHVDLDVENSQPQFCYPVGSNVQWLCTSCNNECLPVTRESRVLDLALSVQA